MTNLQEYMQNPSKVLVHIFNPFKKKTLGLVYDPMKVNEKFVAIEHGKGLQHQKLLRINKERFEGEMGGDEGSN